MKKENIAKVLENVDKEVLIEMLLKKLSNKSNSLKERREKIPLSAFTKELSILESVVKYLKENCKYKYSQIAKILNRDDRTIWTTYNNAKNKDKITVYDSDFDIPIKTILSLFPFKPLFGTITKKGVNNTYWFCFMKIPKVKELSNE